MSDHDMVIESAKKICRCFVATTLNPWTHYARIHCKCDRLPRPQSGLRVDDEHGHDRCRFVGG